MMSHKLNEHTIISEKKEPPKYSVEECREILMFFVDFFTGQEENQLFFRRLMDSLTEEYVSGFEDSAHNYFHEKIRKILFTPYDELPLLINDVKDTDSLHVDIYRWRYNRGK